MNFEKIELCSNCKHHIAEYRKRVRGDEEVCSDDEQIVLMLPPSSKKGRKVQESAKVKSIQDATTSTLVPVQSGGTALTLNQNSASAAAAKVLDPTVAPIPKTPIPPGINHVQTDGRTETLTQNLQVANQVNRRKFKCTVAGCDKEYTTSSHRARHVRTIHLPKPPVDPVDVEHQRDPIIEESENPIVLYACTECFEKFDLVQDLVQHMQNEHGIQCFQDETGESQEQQQDLVKVNESALSENVNVIRISNSNKNELNYMNVFNHMNDTIRAFLIRHRESLETLKVQVSSCSTFVRTTEEDSTISDAQIYFITPFCILTQTADIDSVMAEQYLDILRRSENFTVRGSNLSLKKIDYVEITAAKYQPLRGSRFVELPEVIRKRRAIINPVNPGEDCFKWCIQAYFLAKLLQEERYTDENVGAREKIDQSIRMRLSRMSQPDVAKVNSYIQINWNGLQFPMSLDDINQFLLQNQEISINVFGLTEKNEVCGPRFQYNGIERRRYHINLLYLQDREHPQEIGHFCWIKSKSSLVNAQIRSAKTSKLYICDYCFLIMYTEEKLKEHLKHDCLKVITKMPSPGTNLEFTTVSKQLRAPIVVYADFECALKPIQTCDNNPELHQKRRIERHEATSFGYFIKCYDAQLDKYVSYRGADAGKVFVERLITDLKQLYEDHVFGKCVPIKITLQQESEFRRATVCHICKKPFAAQDLRVRDHCHFTGK